MSIYRIQRNMDLILEGIDKFDVPLILEATQSFIESQKQTTSAIQEFAKLLAGIDDPRGALSGLTDQVTKIADAVGKINVEEIPDTFSFKANLDMRNASDKQGDGIQSLVQYASQYDVLYSGLLDYIIGVARGLEEFKEIFSIGAQGIVIAKEFAKVDGIEEEITLMDFAIKQPEEIVIALSGSTEKEAWKEIFSDKISQMTDDPSDQGKLEKAQQDFLDVFKKLSDGLKKVFNNVGGELENLEPNPSLQKAVESEGFLSSLFKKSNPYKMDAKQISLIMDAVTNVTLKSLFDLIQELKKHESTSTEGIQAASEGTVEQAQSQDQENAPEPGVKVMKRLTEFLKDPELALKIAAILEVSGWNKEKDEKLETVNMKKAKEPLEKELGEKFDDFIDEFNLSAGEDETDDPNEVDNIVDAVVDAAQDQDEPPEIEDVINKAIEDWETQLSDRQKERINAKGRLEQLKQAVKEVTPPEIEPPTDPNKVGAAGDSWAQEHKIDDPKSPLGNPKNFSPKEMRKLIDLFPQIVKQVEDAESDGVDNDQDGEVDEEGEESKIEDSYFRRWSKLAGIIKG